MRLEPNSVFRTLFKPRIAGQSSLKRIGRGVGLVG